jgi:putative ABC transport system permease protein
MMNSWLSGFAYRINIGPDVFVYTAMAIFFITLITICIQSIRSALANPVNSLRTE